MLMTNIPSAQGLDAARRTISFAGEVAARVPRSATNFPASTFSTPAARGL
ncbi:hypothetical protein ACRAWD_18385 [Caulobacter segnis]